MRVRPFFWIFLMAVCSSVLIFAVTISIYRPVPMQAHIYQISSIVTQTAEVRLHLTDSEGLPIDQARVMPHVSMLAMPMGAQQVHVQALGQGVYLAQIRFSMAGVWKIDLIAQAAGFDAAQQSIQLNVV